MKAVLISEKDLEARVIEYDGSYEELKQILLDDSDGRCELLQAIERKIGDEFFIFYCDEEGLYHRYNFTGIFDKGTEILFGPIIVTTADEEGNDAGLTDEQCEKVIAEFKPVSPELAQLAARVNENPRLITMMGSNALHYTI